MMTSFRAALALVLVGCLTVSASAVSITSAPFSLGYGFTGPGGTGSWKTTETSGANTPMVIGDFSFTPVVTGGQFDGSGPSFPARSLTSGGGHTGVSIAYPTQAGFQAVVTGAFVGTLPEGSDFKVKLNIDSVSIYGVAFGGFSAGDENLTFVETTPANPGTSTTLALTLAPDYTSNTSYSQLVWNPTDFEELGLLSTRTFTLASDDLRGIDGFEITGTVELVYLGVPEPTALVLLSAGLIGLVGCARRNRERSRA